MSGNKSLSQSINDIHLKALSTFSKNLLKDIKNTKLRSFTQWHDFSNDHVMHVHLQYLEWLEGARYRKHEVHYFLLHNFDVDSDIVKNEHKTALTDFLNKVIKPRAATSILPVQQYFEFFEHPFLINAKDTTKAEMIRAQIKRGKKAPSRAASLADLYAARFMNGNSNDWYKREDISFPETGKEKDLSAGSYQCDSDYANFYIKHLLHIQQSTQGSDVFSPLVGGASKTGSEASNQSLSENRALALKQYLESDPAQFGFAPFITQGSGETNPVVIDESSDEVSENRNVQFSFYCASDYLDIPWPEDEEARVREEYAVFSEAFDNRIAQCEDAVDNSPATLLEAQDSPILIPRDALATRVRLADVRFQVASAIHRFCVTDGCNLSNLDSQEAKYKSFSGNIQASWFEIDSPSGKHSHRYQKGSWLYYFLAHGKYAKASANKGFRLPESCTARLGKSVQAYDAVLMGIGSTVYNFAASDKKDNPRAFAAIYTKMIAKSDIWAYSFALRKYSDSEWSNIGESFSWQYSEKAPSSIIKKAKYGYDLMSGDNQANIAIYGKLFYDALFKEHFINKPPSTKYWIDDECFAVLKDLKERFLLKEFRLYYLAKIPGFIVYTRTYFDDPKLTKRYDLIKEEDKQVFSKKIGIKDDYILGIETFWLP